MSLPNPIEPVSANDDETEIDKSVLHAAVVAGACFVGVFVVIVALAIGAWAFR